MVLIVGGPGLIVGTADADLITGSVGLDSIYGDSTGTLTHRFDQAGNDIIFGVAGFDNLRGDAATIDGLSPSDFAHGGDDLIFIGRDGTGSNDARGDADTIGGYGAGGDDAIFGSAAVDEIRGDAKTMQDHARGGGDWLHGDGSNDNITGDARDMGGNAVGGADHLFGGAGDDTLRGDARSMSDTARGGNDWLLGGRGNDVLWGDADSLAPSARGGDDVLAGGLGHDTFDFAGRFGHDLVLDFERGDQLVFKDTDAGAVSQALDGQHELVVTVAGDPDIAGSIDLAGVHDHLNGAQVGSDFILA